MRISQLSNRIIKKLSNAYFGLIGKDPISNLKVEPRDDLKEIGSPRGGWVVPESLFDAGSICYCVGCGEDITFDLGLIERFKCDVFAFDPTPRAIRHVQKATEGETKYHFMDVGLWDKEDVLKFFVPQDSSHVSHSLLNLQKTEEHISVNVKRLSHVMKELGHSRLDLLKIDIEGAEYKVIDTIIEDGLDVRVLCVEYDECFCPLDDQYKERIAVSMNKIIDMGYHLVCVQGNGNYTFVKS